MEKVSKPRCDITVTMSAAIVRFEYAAWSGVDGGVELSPYPRRSAQTTENASASRGATSLHIRCVSGNPCSSRTPGPRPDSVPEITASPVSTAKRSRTAGASAMS
jgi:hypothetical protein